MFFLFKGIIQPQKCKFSENVLFTLMSYRCIWVCFLHWTDLVNAFSAEDLCWASDVMLSQQAQDVNIKSGWRWTWHRTDVAFWWEGKLGWRKYLTPVWHWQCWISVTQPKNNKYQRQLVSVLNIKWTLALDFELRWNFGHPTLQKCNQISMYRDIVCITSLAHQRILCRECVHQICLLWWRNKLIYILDGLRVSTFSESFIFGWTILSRKQN